MSKYVLRILQEVNSLTFSISFSETFVKSLKNASQRFSSNQWKYTPLVSVAETRTETETRHTYMKNIQTKTTISSPILICTCIYVILPCLRARPVYVLVRTLLHLSLSGRTWDLYIVRSQFLSFSTNSPTLTKRTPATVS